ncbi:MULTISPECIES: hypothetical protein [unclassified Mesorhizobium]|uniref:hypothetical protein n=1 Tax=unclassified Mesorhizobium TaxID=325217 RepID=UPI001126DD74|nr:MULTISPECIES: hypothetical protein [unclassified Mesorhizobium]TPJ57057.1 hypothetical protein FJ443_30410 [Mesorhizobium sp. B2-6-1]TPM19819.1 hypothetical protein FJ953_15575 [Mesorhizobium sp. B2-3-6]TPN34748.1 hypothetical protein FJ979_21415 [Mesorhizobium sp. B1-1-6]
MTVEVHAAAVAKFANGRKVVSVTRPGTMKVPSNTGPIDQPFNVGDVMLVEAGGRAIVTPLSFAGATDLARAVIEGHSGAVTDSHSLRALATAVIGFAAQVVAPEPTPEPVEAVAVAT